MVDVRIGTGSFADFDVHVDTRWPLVPREGEEIVFEQSGGSPIIWKVRCVRYVTGADEQLVGAQVLVVRQVVGGR